MIEHNCKQYTPEWWSVRRGIPTASNFHRIMMPAKRQLSTQASGYAYQLIGDLYDYHYGPRDEFATAAMRNGTQMEPETRRYYEMERDCDVRQVGFCTTDDGRFGASPDALVGDDGVLELKTPTHATQVAYLIAGTLPTEYATQVHGQLIVTGRKWADFMSRAAGLPPLLVRVEPDDYTEALRKCLEDFHTILDGTRQLIAAMLDPVPATRKPFVAPF